MSADASVSWLRRWNVGTLVILLVLCAADLYLPLARFSINEHMYREIRPGSALPPLTQAVFPARMALIILACTWPVIGILLTAWKKAAARRWLYGLQVLALLQCILTVAALFQLITASVVIH